MRHHVGRTFVGSAGTAQEIIVDHPLDVKATVGCWLLYCPGQSPFWDNYILSCVHLRFEPHCPPPVINVPRATHEVMLIALEPEPKGRFFNRRSPTDPDAWTFLHPMNFVDQIEVPSDEAAGALLSKCVEAVLTGVLWAEPPLSGQVEPWRTTLIRTAAHMRGEEHAT